MPESPGPLCYCVWPTAWGAMGAVSGARGLVRVVLPHYSPGDLREMLAFEHPGAVKSRDGLEEFIHCCQEYFNARPVDFDQFACDLPSEKTFSGRVLRACRGIPRGQTRSYSWLAAAAERPDSARAAAGAIAKNPLPLVVPCHRVVYSGGNLGGFSAPGGVELKRRLLALEGAI